VSGVNETPATDVAELVIDEGESNADLTTEQTEQQQQQLVEEPSAEFTSAELVGSKLPPILRDDFVLAPPYRPLIRIADGDLPDILAAAENIAAKRFYKRGSRLVRISAARELPEELRKDRPDDQRVIVEILPSYLSTEITRVADVTKIDGRSKQPRSTDFPDKYARALLERGEWLHVRPLDAIARSPFVREDGSICDVPGYDYASRCYADFPSAAFPELPSDISRDDALEALATLMAPFDEIPFGTPAALSAFIALILSEAARIATPCTPATVVTAGDPATGKTLVSRIPGIIVDGAVSAPRPWPNSPEEIRKVLFSVLLSGDRLAIFDNVRTSSKIHSAELCAFLTSPVWKDRVLGESGSMALPNLTTIILTGNNISPVDDLARRSLVIRLNANMDRDALSMRTFKIPELESYVKQHRAELLMCALKIIKAHQQSGHVGPTPLASFERWSRLVRDALIWLGMADPVETQRQEADDGRDALADAFATLAPKLEGRKFTAADVCGLTMFDGQLAGVLHDGGCSDPRNATKLGWWLRENRDRYGGDFRLQLVESSTKTHVSKRYHFVRTRDAAGNLDLVGGNAS
jgi:putative DNA primase/helicase